MFPSESTANTAVSAINPASLSAGAANGGWIDMRNYDGNLVFNVQLGAVTGSVVVKVQDATDSGGTGVADISGVATASLNTANSTTQLVMDSRKARGWVRAVATVTTGPIVMGVTMVGRPKTV
jgi:hypothetical protein